MTSNFDSLNDNKVLEDKVKVNTIEEAVCLIYRIIDQLRLLETTLGGFGLVRENNLCNAFGNSQNKKLEVVIDCNQNPQWIMFLDEELSLTVGGLDSNFSLALNNKATNRNIGILYLDDSNNTFIGDSNSNYDKFSTQVIDLMNKFDIVN